MAFEYFVQFALSFIRQNVCTRARKTVKIIHKLQTSPSSITKTDLLNLSSWCLVMVERLFLAVPRGCLQFVIVVFPGHTHLLFLKAGILYPLIENL